MKPRARANQFPTAFLLILPLIVAAAGCAQHRPVVRSVPPPPSPGSTEPAATEPARPEAAPSETPAVPTVKPVAPGAFVEKGLASWYGVPYHGRRAANGEIYDMYKMTAAHRTLPFNSLVRVTNLKNGRTIEVRITDRGPFVENRIIDLSLAAARALDMVAAGVAPVRLELVASPVSLEGNFTVQVGAFQDRQNAERLRHSLETRYQPVFIDDFDSPSGHFYRVQVGRVPTEQAARQLAAKLQSSDGFRTFVVRLNQ